VETFDGDGLDRSVWFPYYLPHWSSRAATAASLELVEEGLRLHIPPDQPLWCPDSHPTPLRVSGIASGAWSGPVGSTLGPQPFRSGLTVREEQPRFEGWLPEGRVEIHCRMTLSHRSMAAMWLAGFEDEPARSGEICVVEVFGRDLDDGRSAAIGVGHKQLGDPALVEDFEAPRVEVDVSEVHRYAVERDADHSVFTVDGVEVKRCVRPPTYPVQIMLAVFDFPEWSRGDDAGLVPELVVTEIAE
jgi:hypothetical protein